MSLATQLSAAFTRVGQEVKSTRKTLAIENMAQGGRSVAYGKNSLAYEQYPNPVTVTITGTGDASYNREYARGANATPPAQWPVDTGRGIEFLSSGFTFVSRPTPYAQRPVRVMTDAPKIAFYVYGSIGGTVMVFVDGQPTTVEPQYFANTSTYLIYIDFQGVADTRLIEVVTAAGIASVYVPTPYTCWRPDPFAGPKVLVTGDSFTAPTVMYDPPTTGYNIYDAYRGAYQSMSRLLDLEEILIDGQGGTGFIAPGQAGFFKYLDRLNGSNGSTYNNAAFNPDVLVVHGGGANDVNQGSNNAAIIAAATTYFQTARTLLPNAKLVFVEGFSPPGFVYNTQYTAIRTALQSALTATGVYYIDVATTDPWIKGTGTTHAPVSDGNNSSIYIGNDAVHLNGAGNAYVRDRMAPRLRTILRDNGQLVNQLIT